MTAFLWSDDTWRKNVLSTLVWVIPRSTAVHVLNFGRFISMSVLELSLLSHRFLLSVRCLRLRVFLLFHHLFSFLFSSYEETKMLRHIRFRTHWSIHNLTNLFSLVTCGVRHFLDTTGSVKVSRVQKDDVASLRTALLWRKETILLWGPIICNCHRPTTRHSWHHSTSKLHPYFLLFDSCS